MLPAACLRSMQAIGNGADNVFTASDEILMMGGEASQLMTKQQWTKMHDLNDGLHIHTHMTPRSTLTWPSGPLPQAAGTT